MTTNDRLDDSSDDPHDECRAKIEELEAQLASMAKGVSIKIPTDTMEQEFAAHYRRGALAERRRCIEIVGRLTAGLQRENLEAALRG